jgi:hypothetical protein
LGVWVSKDAEINVRYMLTLEVKNVL